MEKNRDKIFESIQFVPSGTRVEAWVFEIDGKFYHVASYTGYRIGDKTSVWEANKKGKRTSPEPIFTINGSEKDTCIELFVDKLEADETIAAQ